MNFYFKQQLLILCDRKITRKLSYALVAYNWLCLINIEINFTKLTQGFYAASNEQLQSVTFCTVFFLCLYFLGGR